MKHIYATDSAERLEIYRGLSERLIPRLQRFLDYLEEAYQVSALPRCIVWTDHETATHLISDIPLPAYTNSYRTVFCPEVDVWRDIYLHQLVGTDCSEIERYYCSELSDNHIMQILGHEFVHHSDLFMEEVYEASRWFEEGMCEYISRRFFLTSEEFVRAEEIQKQLVSSWESRYGCQPLESFNANTYSNSIGAILYEYWRSFLTVKKVIEKESGNLMSVFEKYQSWCQKDCPVPLIEWF